MGAFIQFEHMPSDDDAEQLSTSAWRDGDWMKEWEIINPAREKKISRLVFALRVLKMHSDIYGFLNEHQADNAGGVDSSDPNL